MLRTIVLLTFFCLASSLMKAQYSKIDAFLQTALEQAPDEQYHEVYILLDEQIDLQFLQQNANNNGKRRHEKRKDILKAAQQLARHTQPLIQTKLENLAGVEPYSLQAYWIVNGFQVRANAKAIRTISQWSEVQWIEPVQENILFDKAAKGVSMPSSPNRAEQGLKAINAHKMWELGYTGYGTKVLVVDSGNALEHPALYHNFWGNNVPVEHAWTGQALPEACNNHGTQVTGVIAGLDRTTNDTIGVAPNAHWMGAPLNIGDCSLRQDIRNTVQVFEWAIDPDGNINTTEDSPDVINNSWGNASPVCERTYTDILTLLEALDIAVVWAGGNSGQEGAMSVYGTQNINATLVNTFTVGNLNGRTLNISDDSSRGPSYCGLSGSLAIKPEVSAPGQSIRSATIDGEYNAVSGTSFSAPHVAGALLLLREAFPEVSSENLKLALYYSARDLGQAGEDNAYGMGIIDVFAAYQYLIAEGNTPTPPVSTANDAVMVDIQTTRAVHCLGSVAVSVTFENNGENTLNTLQIEYFVEDNIQDTKTITWNGTLEKNEVASINLTDLDELPAGQHELNVRISAPNGQVDTRPLNNAMKNYIEIVDLEYVRAELDVTYANAICENARAVLHSASPLEEGQEIVWYDRPEGSVSLNVGRLGEGTPFLTDPIEAS
ncbi:MAG: S8 family serine peptidase, partial [Bacteroidota bacterium]